MMLNCMRYPNLEVHIMRSFLNTYANTCLDQGHREGYKSQTLYSAIPRCGQFAQI